MTEVFPGRPKVSTEKKNANMVKKKKQERKIGNKNSKHGLRPSCGHTTLGHF